MFVVVIDLVFMYCLFVYCGEEVIDDVLDGFNLVVFDEVENWLYV